MKYWRLISLDTTGKRKSAEIPEAKAFFTEAFLSSPDSPGLEDAHIVRQLFNWFRGHSPNTDATISDKAELCLRCFISDRIESNCIQLEQKFGTTHGFTRHDLFPFVLNDVIPIRPTSDTSYTTLATEILLSFNPEKGNLSTWTNRLILQHRELKAFLLEHGVYIISDWAILNDTTPKQLQRILSEFHHLTNIEIQQAVNLLSSYHAVYRQQRFAQRKAGTKGQCPQPTDEQLRQIGQPLNLPPQTTIARLQNLASRLREYRIAVRRKTPQTVSLDNPKITLVVNSQPADYTETATDNNWQSEFLKFYRQQFIDSLDTALQQVTQKRLTILQGKNSATASQFTTALHLFHCQKESMSSIAQIIGLQAQYQVTRLLKLKDFRADVQRQMLILLSSSILDRATVYATPQNLSTLSQKVSTALDEQITEMIQLASAESSTANRSDKSLFAQRLCKILAQLAR